MNHVKKQNRINKQTPKTPFKFFCEMIACMVGSSI